MQSLPKGTVPLIGFQRAERKYSQSPLGAKCPKIGKLLLDANMITHQSLQTALSIGAEMRQPIGRTLTTLNVLSEQEVRSALMAQAMIANGSLTEAQAVLVLAEAARRRVPLNEYLTQRLVDPTHTTDSLIGELLVGSFLLTQETYDRASHESATSGVPMGRTLMVMNAITLTGLNSVLEAVVLIRKGEICREEGIRALRVVRHHQVSFAEALSSLRIRPNVERSIRIGEVLVLGGFTGQREVLSAVEAGLKQEQMVGHILIESGYVTRHILDAALKVQEWCNRGVIKRATIREIFRKFENERKTLVQIAAELQLFEDVDADSMTALALMFESRIVTFEQTDGAQKYQSNLGFAMAPVQALLASGVISYRFYQCVLDCVVMLKSGEITLENASKVLQFCERNCNSFIEGLSELGVMPVSISDKQTDVMECIELAESSPQGMSIASVIALIAYLVGLAAVVFLVPHKVQLFAFSTISFLAVCYATVAKLIAIRQSEREKAAAEEKAREARELKARMTRKTLTLPKM